MKIQQFIEKAIEGGWNGAEYVIENGTLRQTEHNAIYKALLDPEAWKAVGKVEGWDEGEYEDVTYPLAPFDMPMWQWKMHRMIDALAEGKTVEGYLETLTPKKE